MELVIDDQNVGDPWLGVTQIAASAMNAPVADWGPRWKAALSKADEEIKTEFWRRLITACPQLQDDYDLDSIPHRKPADVIALMQAVKRAATPRTSR